MRVTVYRKGFSGILQVTNIAYHNLFFLRGMMGNEGYYNFAWGFMLRGAQCAYMKSQV